MWDLFLSNKLETLEAIYSVQATEKNSFYQKLKLVDPLSPPKAAAKTDQ